LPDIADFTTLTATYVLSGSQTSAFDKAVGIGELLRSLPAFIRYGPEGVPDAKPVAH